MTNLTSGIKGYFEHVKDYYRERGNIETSKKDQKTSSASASALKACAHCHEKLNNCFRSQIDHGKEINMEIWAVSVVIKKGDWEITDLFIHHTMLIIEGFTSQGKFWQRAHLTGPGIYGNLEAIQDCFSGHSNVGQVQVTDEKYYPFDLSKCKKYRQTWTSSREKIEVMLERMIWEQQHPESTPFRFLGEKSFVSIKREFLDTSDPELVKMENNNREHFKELCCLFEQKTSSENFKRKKLVFFKSMSRILTFSFRPIRMLPACMQPLMCTALMEDLPLKLLRADPKILLALASVYLVSGFFLERHHMGNLLLEEKFKENNEQLCFLKERAKPTIAISQNCFNWSRKHLKVIDVELPEKGLEKVIAIPELYLPNGELITESCSKK